MLRLGVNVDHAATLRQARYREVERGMVPEPSPVEFARESAAAGAHGITAHLREDRRHMQEADLLGLAEKIRLPLNLEMANTAGMLAFALRLRPANICMVPENRREVTTEGGLRVRGAEAAIRRTVERLQRGGSAVSLFIDPVTEEVRVAAETGARFVELHTGAFSRAVGRRELAREVRRLAVAAELAHGLGVGVNAGHGINYGNVRELFGVPHLHELNIGHSIVSRALMVGARRAVREMLDLMRGYRP
jgi:pyridoxine 5-phosphate synthase